MDPEIQKQIAALIEAAREAGSDTASFIAAQAPDVVAQLVHWRIAEGITAAILCGTGIVLLLWAMRALFRWRVAEDGDVEDRSGVCVAVSIAATMAGVAMVIGLYGGIIQTTKATLAPKVVIMEAIADVARGK